jgi:hypothetical protein
VAVALPVMMTEVRKADPAARRRALTLVIVGAAIGAVLIIGFERYRVPLRDWLLSESGNPRLRLKLVFFLVATGASVPLLGFAAFLWSLGGKVSRAQEFPPPGYRVIRDTPVIRGSAAVFRARGLKGLALGLGIASALLWGLLWRLFVILSER